MGNQIGNRQALGRRTLRPVAATVIARGRLHIRMSDLARDHRQIDALVEQVRDVTSPEVVRRELRNPGLLMATLNDSVDQLGRDASVIESATLGDAAEEPSRTSSA